MISQLQQSKFILFECTLHCSFYSCIPMPLTKEKFYSFLFIDGYASNKNEKLHILEPIIKKLFSA